jgi:hypothetical protein
MEVVKQVKREHLHSGDVQDCDGNNCTKRAVVKISRPVSNGTYTHEFYCKSCAEDVD